MKSILFILMFIVLSGCSANSAPLQNRAAIEKNEKDGTVIINSGKERTYTGQNEVEKFEAKHEIAEVRAEKIADEINKMPQVKKAAVVVAGNTAIVGLSLNEDLTDGKLIELKKSVEKAVKKIDAGIDHAAVSSAPDLYKKILRSTGSPGQDSEEPENNDTENRNKDILFRLVPTV